MKNILSIVALTALAVSPVHGQWSQSAAGDSLRLGALHRKAEANDPRQKQFLLLDRQTDLRLQNLSAERLPVLRAETGSQTQSDVFSAPTSASGGVSLPSPSRTTWDSRIVVEQSVLAPTLSARRNVEEAQHAESRSSVRTALFGLRQEVNDAFFDAALLDERGQIISANIAELEKRLHEAQLRVKEGVALPSDTAAIRATLLEREQDLAGIEADKHSARARLAELIKRPVSASDPFALPDLALETTRARQDLAHVRARPEYERFALTRERLAREQEEASARLRPHVSAFAHAGYGQPGLNPISDEPDSYFVLGVRMQWEPWNWGSTNREREVLSVQQQILVAEEDAFVSRLQRDVQIDLADIDRLDAILVLDDQIVTLRERVETETSARFREGVVTASEFLDRSTDVLEARLARSTHRVEQVQARARFLTTLGLEIR